MCAAAARRAAILRVREPGCALACRATIGTTSTQTYLDTDWRASEIKRPSAVGLSDFSPTQKAEHDSTIESKKRLFCPSRSDDWKGNQPLVDQSPPRGCPAPSNGAAYDPVGVKSGRVDPTWPCLWVFGETVARRTGKQIFIGKKWFGRGQVVSPCQIYGAPSSWISTLFFTCVYFGRLFRRDVRVKGINWNNT